MKFQDVKSSIFSLLFDNSCLCIIFVLIILSNKSNFVYVLVHRNILMYDICFHAIIYVDVHLKTILGVSLFSIIL